MLNLDTHILVASLAGDLTPREEDLVLAESLVVADIVLWELAKLVQLKRLTLDMDSVAFRRVLRHLTIIPITIQIARQSTKLDFASDPADELIAATSIVERIPLLTRDKKILKSRVVPLAK
ncbi:MAG: type II toxin-antitoxin system VapC family toxin [Chloracidobacterium sp.]|nr:type II toxin-antitoxin system VapC family toxin [Chloracidobacterium sp.]